MSLRTLDDFLAGPESPLGLLRAVTATVGQLTGSKLVYAWAGDLRVHVRDPGGAWCIRPDHTAAAEVEARTGVRLDDLALEHQVATRAIGDIESAPPEVAEVDLPDGGDVLVCTRFEHAGRLPEAYASVLFDRVMSDGKRVTVGESTAQRPGGVLAITTQ